MLEKYDAIVELGYRFDPEWKLPPYLIDSLRTTSELYKKQYAPLIIVCGKWSLSFERENIVPPFTEAAEMKNNLMVLGVPEKSIITEEHSKDTIGNAYYTKKTITEPRKLNSLLIVCADFHAIRAKYIFNKIFGSSYNLGYQLVKTPYSAEIEQIQASIHKKQKEFLEPMKDGDHSFLNEKLYSHDFFQMK